MALAPEVRLSLTIEQIFGDRPLRKVCVDFSAQDARALFNAEPTLAGFEAQLSAMQARDRRRDFLVQWALQMAHAMADRWEDAEGWHGTHRQTLAEQAQEPPAW